MGLLSQLLPEHELKDRKKAKLMLMVAHLLYDERGRSGHRVTQEEVAAKLRAGDYPDMRQSTVSALLDEAERCGIVSVVIKPPRALDLEQQLAVRFAPHGVRDIFIVPPGGGRRNEANLGPLGARVLLTAIQHLSATKSTIRITFSCGATLRSVVQNLLDLVRLGQEPHIPDGLQLHVYPSTLYTDHEVRAIYPSTLATTLKIMWPSSDVPELKAFTADLPANFYHRPARVRREFVKHCRLDDLVDNAGQADIFVIGIGDSRDDVYAQIVRQLNVTKMSREAIGREYPLEIAYIPLDRRGNHLAEVADRVVGIKLDTLRAAAKDPDRFVIGTIGGSDKARAGILQPAILSKCFNTIITDEEVARLLPQGSS